jgi:hypothetical protein
MPVRMFGKTFSGHRSAAKAARSRGVRKADALVGSVERRQRGGGNSVQRGLSRVFRGVKGAKG